MLTDLDDLFRQELDGHASPPAPDLWARLQARTAAELPAPPPDETDSVDVRFRAGLAEYATPPRRELWERLEDEHLRPRRRPVVAWGRLAVAATLLLLLLAGGAGWWHQHQAALGPVAATGSQGASHPDALGPRVAEAPARAWPQHIASASPTATKRIGEALNKAYTSAAQHTNPHPHDLGAALAATTTAERKKNRPRYSVQATASPASASSRSVASSRFRRLPAPLAHPVPGQPALPPDAPATLPALGGQSTADNQPINQPEPAALAAASPQVIEVEVRRGTREPAATATVAAAPVRAAKLRPRLRLGGLLQQAGHALHGEPMSLADATGLPKTMTMQARLGNRVLVHTIQL